MASGSGEAPPDGDAAPPERQPEREGDTLRLFFPLPATFNCCERGCRAAYNPEVWTSRRQSLQRHLETEHGARIRSTINVCNISGEVLGPRPTTHRCLVRRLAAGPPPPPAHRHQCALCPSSFPTRRGLTNHEQRHRREAAQQARQATTPAAPGSSSGPQPPPSPTQGGVSSLAVLPQPAPSPPQSPAPEARSQGDPASPPLSGPGDVSVEPAALPGEPDVLDLSDIRHMPTTSPAALEGGERSPAPPAEESPGDDPIESPAASSISIEQQPTPLREQHPSPQAEPAGPRDGIESQFTTQGDPDEDAGPEGSAWILLEDAAELRALTR
ncbi:hypothetical protein HPB50_011525 [Hyalomma asiaticum]|uniref:Uncharacterized protein n=1 Tax=Hyalomma asiaticum TaxID=266040 RepID=A0ACB7T7T0_HYAAI|nr:hypothetical protein HPB50_011525 [Hyalomma asiaticum]